MTIDFWLPHVKIAGGTKVSLTYADELRKRGHAVRIFVRRTSWRDRFRRQGTWKGIFPLPFTYVKDWSDACDGGSDAIIADSWEVAGALLACAPPRARLFELIQHDERLFHGTAEKVEAVYRSPALEKIVVATWLKELFAAEFGTDTHLLLNTVNRDAFFPTPKLRATNGSVRVLLLVHSYPWKGTAEGLAAVEAVQAKHPNVRIIGFGVRERMAPSGVNEYHYDPTQERLRELYASSDIFLCPSWVEGFGLPSLEAMACGAALVTYENGGSRDFATDGVTALVAPRKDQAVLRTKLEQAVCDAGLRERIGTAGMRFAEKLPTWSEQAARLERILTT